MSVAVPLIPQVRCALGEGPVWDERRQCLWWLDILQGVIHSFTPESSAYRCLNVGEMVGCIALREDGNLIGALKSGYYLIDADTGAKEFLAHPETHISENRFNDGKADPHGRLLAGTMSMHDVADQGALYLFDTSTGAETQFSPVSISNGLAWSADGKTLYYIDTPDHVVRAFDYSAERQALSNERIVIHVPDDFGSPDGMTIDEEEHLWIAHWDGWQVTRWNSETGECVQKIAVPAARATSCTFGGPDFKDLYITTAYTGIGEANLADQPLAGSLFVVKNSGFQGRPFYRFRG